MEQYTLITPGLVIGGKDSPETLRELIKKLKPRRVALFTDGGVRRAGLCERYIQIFKQEEVELGIMDDIPSEPMLKQAQDICDRAALLRPDVLMAIGGGSVMDCAKLASVCIGSEYSVSALMEDASCAKKSVPTIMVPTTAGTGAEATPNAIVTVPEKELKVGIVSRAMIADYVLLDADNTKTLPRSIAASTGVDALAHAIECFTSNKATPFCDMFALEAIRLISASILEASQPNSSWQARNDMLLASFYAGVAIAAGGTTAVHALAYPLGGRYHVAHGVSNAILLYPVMCFNRDAIVSRLARVYNIIYTRADALDEDEKSIHVINWLKDTVEALDIPQRLDAFIAEPEQELDSLVEGAFNVKRLLNNNIKPLSKDDIREIYKKLM